MERALAFIRRIGLAQCDTAPLMIKPSGGDYKGLSPDIVRDFKRV
jgi:hypothetical protein